MATSKSGSNTQISADYIADKYGLKNKQSGESVSDEKELQYTNKPVSQPLSASYIADKYGLKKKDGISDGGTSVSLSSSQLESFQYKPQEQPKIQTKQELTGQVKQIVGENLQTLIAQSSKDKVDYKPILQGVEKGDVDSIKQLKDRIVKGYQQQISTLQRTNDVSTMGGGGGSFGGMSVPIQTSESPEQTAQIQSINDKISKATNTLNKYLTFSLASTYKKLNNGKIEQINPADFGKHVREQLGDDAEAVTERNAAKSHSREGEIANQNIDYKNSQAGLAALIEETESDYADLQTRAKKDPSLNKDLQQKQKELNYLYNSNDNLLDRYPQVAQQNVSSVIGDKISEQKGFWNIGTYTSHEDVNKAIDALQEDNPAFINKWGKYIDEVRQNPALVQDRGFLGAAKVSTANIGRYFQRQFNTDADAAAMRVEDENRTSLKPTALSGAAPSRIILGSEGKSFIPVSNKENFGKLNPNNSMRFIGNAVPDLVAFVGLEAVTAGTAGIALEAIKGAGIAERIGESLGVAKNLYRTSEEIEAAAATLKAQKAAIGNAAAFYLTGYEPNLRYAESLIKEDTPEADTKRSLLANFLTIGQIVSFKALDISPTKILQRSIIKGAAEDAMKFLEKKGFEGITKEETYKAIADSFIPRIKAVAGQLGEVGKEGGKMAIANVLTEAFKDLGTRVVDSSKGLSVEDYKDAAVTGALQGVVFGGILRTTQIAKKLISNPNVDALHEAALNSDKYIGQINEAVNDGRMKRTDGNDIIASIKTAHDILSDQTKFLDKNGNPLNDRKKAKILANEFLKSAANLIENKEIADEQREAAQDRIDEIKSKPDWVDINETPIIKDLNAIDEFGNKITSFNDIDAAAKYSIEEKQKTISGADLIEEINNKVNDYNHEENKVSESENAEAPERQGEISEGQNAQAEIESPFPATIRNDDFVKQYFSDAEKEKYNSADEDSKKQMIADKKSGLTDTAAQEDTVSVGDMLDKKGTYQGKRGTFVQDGQAVVFKVDDSNREYELGNIDEVKGQSIKDWSIEQEESVVKLNDDGTIESRGKKYTNPNEGDPLKAIRRNKEGNITGVTLVDEKGREVTFRGQRAEDLAYQLHLNELTKDNETRNSFEDFINTDEGARQEIDNAGLPEATPELATEDNAAVQRTKLEPEAGVNKKSQSKTSENESKSKKRGQESASQKGKEDGKKDDATNVAPQEGGETEQAPSLKETTKPEVSNIEQPKEAAQAYMDSAARLREQGDIEGAEKLEEAAKTIGEDNKTPEEKIEDISKNMHDIEKIAFGITHESNSVRRFQMRMNQYEKVAQTFEQWDKAADELLKEGYNVDDLISDVERNKRSTNPIENALLKKYIATLDSEIETKPTKDLVARRKRFVEMRDLANSAAGRDLVSLKGFANAEANLGGFLQEKMESMGVNELSTAQIKEQQAKYEELKKVQDEYSKKIDELQRDNERLKTQKGLEKETAKIRKRKDKTHEDFVKERKDILQQMRDDLLKVAKGGGGLTSSVPGAAQLAAIAPHVGKLVRSLAEEGINKLDDVINRIHEDIKDHLPGVTKKDVRDIIAGRYNEKQPTKNELTEQLRNFKKEASLLNELDKVRKEDIGTNEKKQTEKTRRISELENKIKEAKQLNKDKAIADEPVFEAGKSERDYRKQLADEQKKIKKQITDIESKISKKIYSDEPETIIPLKLDKRTQELQDRLIDLKRKRALELAKDEYSKKSKWAKGLDKFWEVVGLKRVIQTAVDFSMPFRQAVVTTMNPFKIKTTGEAFKNMFLHTASPKEFKRFMFKLEESGLKRDMEKDGIVLSEPDELVMDKRDEAFRTGILDRIRQSEKKIATPIKWLLEPVFSSERAAASFMNTIRINEYIKKTDYLKRQGITRENNPKAYKDISKWIMNSTGRGNMLTFLEESKSGKEIVGNTFYGARLMASRFNMLNPVYYLKMPKEVRIEAMKDMAGFTSGIVLSGIALAAAGGKISFNPDDPDFFQVRFGDKVYDLTGGMVQYVRTFLRISKLVGMRLDPNSDEDDLKKYAGFVGRSTTKFFTNKLAPNTAYAYHFITGKGGDGKDFRPDEILDYYPMYVDDLTKGWESDGAESLMTILLPSIFGMGVQQYEQKDSPSFGSGGGGTTSKY